MTNANLARNRIGGPLFFALESRFVALLPAGNTGSCTPYFALSGSIRAPVRPISPSRAQYGLWLRLLPVGQYAYAGRLLAQGQYAALSSTIERKECVERRYCSGKL